MPPPPKQLPPAVVIRLPAPHKQSLEDLAKKRKTTVQELGAVAIMRLILEETEGQH